jgi:hypothetical protein
VCGGRAHTESPLSASEKNTGGLLYSSSWAAGAEFVRRGALAGATSRGAVGVTMDGGGMNG